MPRYGSTPETAVAVAVDEADEEVAALLGRKASSYEEIVEEDAYSIFGKHLAFVIPAVCVWALVIFLLDGGRPRTSSRPHASIANDSEALVLEERPERPDHWDQSPGRDRGRPGSLVASTRAVLPEPSSSMRLYATVEVDFGPGFDGDACEYSVQYHPFGSALPASRTRVAHPSLGASIVLQLEFYFGDRICQKRT